MVSRTSHITYTYGTTLRTHTPYVITQHTYGTTHYTPHVPHTYGTTHHIPMAPRITYLIYERFDIKSAKSVLPTLPSGVHVQAPTTFSGLAFVLMPYNKSVCM
jgi:hypothetical protein